MTEGTANTTRRPTCSRATLDDLEVGDSFTTKGRTITEADIVNFAALTWDTYPLHVDAEWASKTMFGERIAHGMLVLSYAAGLVPMQPGPIVAFYGMEKVRFFAPTKIGDTIRVHVELKEKEERDDDHWASRPSTTRSSTSATRRSAKSINKVLF